MDRIRPSELMTVNEIAAKLNEIVDWINAQSDDERLRTRVNMLHQYRISDNSRVSARIDELASEIELIKKVEVFVPKSDDSSGDEPKEGVRVVGPPGWQQDK